MPTINISGSKSWVSKQQCILPKILHEEEGRQTQSWAQSSKERENFAKRSNKQMRNSKESNSIFQETSKVNKGKFCSCL